MKRKIGVVTGSRAEYGLLYWFIRKIMESDSCELQLFVTGMHLSPEFGMTVNEIEKSGVPIARRVEMLLSSDTPAGISKSIGLGVISFADVFSESRPDVLLVLGDRFETFAAVTAALMARIPVAHCHGGELTEGAVDESLRHSITKMSHLHFASAPEYAKRIKQLGEDPSRIYTVGALGLEGLRKLRLASRTDVEQFIRLSLEVPTLMVTYHPVTLENNTAEEQFGELLRALDVFPDTNIVFTKPNADAHGRVIISMIDDYVNRSNGRVVAFTSMGQFNYLSALQYVSAVVGNSSSGIIEAPSFKKPTVNIGDRQKGRVKAESTIDCGVTRDEIAAAIRKSLSPEFSERVRGVTNPYDHGDPSGKIMEVISSIPLDSLVKKKFFDL